MGPQTHRPQDHERIDIRDLVAGPPNVASEFLDELEATSILCVRIVLGIVGAEIAVGDRPGERVDQSVGQNVTVGVGVESDVGRNSHASEHEFVPGEEPVDVVADACAIRGHCAEARRSSIVRTALRSAGNVASVAWWTMEPAG